MASKYAAAPEALEPAKAPVVEPILEGATKQLEPPRRRAPLLSARNLLEGPGLPWLRLGVDAVAILLALAAAVLGAGAADVSTDRAGLLWLLGPLVILALHARGMYRRRLRSVILDGVGPVVGAISLAAMGVLAVGALLDPATPTGSLLVRAWLFCVLYVGAGRIAIVLLQRHGRVRFRLGRPSLIVGAGLVGAQIARRLEDRPEYGLRPIGFLDDDPPPGVAVADRRAPVLGGPGDLAEVAADTGAEHVILAFSSSPDRGLVPLVRRCDELGLEVSLVPRLYESINERVALEHLGGLPLLELRTVDPQGWQFGIKHAIDRVVAGLALLVGSPVILGVALAVRLTSPGPILFRQTRVGRDGQVFDLLKFRSMREPEDEEAPGAFRPAVGSGPGGVEGVDRRTPIGRWLRRTSLDELPQLFNVLKGEMSLIGPRPERPEFVELFHQDVARYSDRHRVKSGITGWAQCHGLRGQTSLADRVEWDNFYIENWSLWLDVKIVLLTFQEIVRWGHED